MSRWYAVQTKARQERIAREHLSRQGFHVCLPMIRASKRRRGRWQVVAEALFPGYLFIELDLECQNAAPIRSTRGVVALVHCGRNPSPMPDDLMRQLLKLSGGEDSIIESPPPIEPGDRVELVDGAMAGLTAIVQQKTGEKRVLLLMELLGRENRVEVDVDHLVPAR